MTGRPDLYKITVDPKKPNEAIRELNIHQDRVRIAFNEKRTFLAKSPKMREPVDGELLYSEDGELYLCVGTIYKKVYPPTVSQDIPDWFIRYIQGLEREMIRRNIPKEKWSMYGGGL
jgi:hypothetical protein